MLLLQLALIEHADKQCCIMLLSCSDSRHCLGLHLCMIVARLCCFTAFVCMNRIHDVIEMHDMQCCCHVLGSFERQVASPTLILKHVCNVPMHVSTTEVPKVTAAKSHFAVMWLHLTSASNLVQGEGAISQAVQHPPVKRSNSMLKLQKWLRKLKPSRTSHI